MSFKTSVPEIRQSYSSRGPRSPKELNWHLPLIVCPVGPFRRLSVTHPDILEFTTWLSDGADAKIPKFCVLIEELQF